MLAIVPPFKTGTDAGRLQAGADSWLVGCGTWGSTAGGSWWLEWCVWEGFSERWFARRQWYLPRSRSGLVNTGRGYLGGCLLGPSILQHSRCVSEMWFEKKTTWEAHPFEAQIASAGAGGSDPLSNAVRQRLHRLEPVSHKVSLWPAIATLIATAGTRFSK